MRRFVALVALSAIVDVAAAGAQSVAETPISNRSTLVIETIDGRSIARLARAANVPMGLVRTTALPDKFAIRTAGRRLGDVLDQLVAADPRYEWRDVDGVIVIRAAHIWSDFLLPRPIAGLTLINADASDAGTVLAQMTGHEHISGQISDSRTFSVDVSSGATLFDALNAIVRAHGSLAWAMGPPDGSRNPTFVANLMLFSGSSGSGFGVRDNAVMNPRPLRVERRERENRNRSSVDWDRIVPDGFGGQPIKAAFITESTVGDLAKALCMPMGIESIPLPIQPRDGIEFTVETLSGRTLGDALGVLSRLDPRYQWRDMGGVIVFRPVAAWSDTRHPLSRRIEGFRLTDAVLTDVMAAFGGRLGARAGEIVDTHRFSIDSPAGSILDAVNAIVRSHGHLYWQFGVPPAGERQFHPGMSRHLGVRSFGPDGVGVLIP